MSERLRCLVPHCRRTRRFVGEGCYVQGLFVAYTEWICQQHWTLVPTKLRALHTAAKRKLRRTETVFAFRVGGRVWSRCKRAAIEGALGI